MARRLHPRRAEDAETANTLYQEAEAMLADSMLSIPLWYQTTPVGWSDRVSSIYIQ